MKYTVRIVVLFLLVYFTLPIIGQVLIILDTDIEPIDARGDTYIQGNAGYQRVLDNIIDTDDFENMRDLPADSLDYQLGRAVGWIIMPQRANPTRYWICTGFLVSPDLFMTNHHCLYDGEEPHPLDSMLIFMDYYQKSDVDLTRGGVTAGVLEILHADATKDYALLRLDTPIGNTYGWLELDTAGVFDASQSVKIIQHPRGRPKEIVRRNSGIVDIPIDHPLADVPFALAYLADTEGGSSGSPVFLQDGSSVIGIHHSAWTFRGAPHFNAGTLMAYIVPEIQQWLPSENAPDLTVARPQLSSDYASPNKPLTLSVTVRNQGTAASAGTTLRFYASLDTEITNNDTEIGVAFMGSLLPNESVKANITLIAPTSLGTHYYGACIDAVGGDTRPDNNCSTATTLTVKTTDFIRMYWVDLDVNKIQRANVDGSHIETLVEAVHGLRRPRDIDVDMVNHKMYWVDDDYRRNVIQRANLDGTHIEDVLTEVERPDRITLDVAGEMMYWVDADGIRRAHLDGSNIETLSTGNADDIALDMAAGKMYWTRSNSIHRSNLNGTDREDLVTDIEGTGKIALDAIGGKMYWVDAGADVIQRSNLDGTHIETLLTRDDGLLELYGIALDIDAGMLYWADWGADRIQRSNLDGSNVENLITRGLNHVIEITLGVPPSETYRTVQLSPTVMTDQSFIVDEKVSRIMPIAHGGTPSYTYTLTPNLPTGLQFDAGNRSVSGTPTEALSATTFTYTATDVTGASINLNFTIEVMADEPDPIDPVPVDTPLDVNRDGLINILDLIWVAVYYGQRGKDLAADVNSDGIVNVQDFIAVAAVVDAAETLSAHIIETTLAEVEGVADAPNIHNNIIAALADTDSDVLRQLLAVFPHFVIPEATALLPNYPNPFNPETWIPYTLSSPSHVEIRIHAIDGRLVKRIDVGYQQVGFYADKHRAVHWNGRNDYGEPVVSGVYFYTLTANEFTATQKMLIRK